MNFKAQKIPWSKIIRLSLILPFAYSFIHEIYLACIGYPSVFDYKYFNISFWLTIMLYSLLGFKSRKKNKDSEGVENSSSDVSWESVIIWIVIVVGVIVIKLNDDEINDFKYELPLAKIETIQLTGKLSVNTHLTRVYKRDMLWIKNPIVLEEYPDKEFQLRWKKQLKNEINTVQNDTLFLKKGETIKIRLRGTDYKRMMSGETNSAFFKKNRFDGKSFEIYELIYDDKIIFKSLGIK